jgi:TRAP-type transport system small permease protein
MNVLDVVAVIDRLLQRTLAIACVLLLAVMLGAIGLQITMRYAFNQPLVWSEELARFTMVWMAMLSAALAMRQGQHIAMEGLLKFSGRLRLVVSAICVAASVGVLLVLLHNGVQFVQRTGLQRSPALGLAMSYVYLAIPVASGLMLAGLVFDRCARLRGIPRDNRLYAD